MCSSSPLTKPPMTKAVSATNSSTNRQPCFNSSPPTADKVTSTPQVGSVASTSPDDSVTRSQFQCETCGLQLSSRNGLYKQRMRKDKTPQKVEKPAGSRQANGTTTCQPCFNSSPPTADKVNFNSTSG